jgi:cytochrome c-type biogenesis protein CcmH/NrfF
MKSAPPSQMRVPHVSLLRHGVSIPMKKFLQLALVAIVITVSTGAGDPTARFDKLSHQIMCPCGCNELLGECNHVGCPDSDGMRGKLMSAVNHGDSDKAIFISFQDEYGPTALAAPRFTAFNHLAWIAPYFLLVFGVSMVAFFVRRWRLQPATVPARPKQFSSSEFDQVRDRIRRDTDT